MSPSAYRPSAFDSLGPATCIIYVRISQDRSGEQLGIDRQERECRELAARLGLHVEAVLVDNDVSATSGVRRPDFERLLTSRPEAVVTWHQDRLLRLSSDLERVIGLGVPIYTVVAGTLDLATPAGRAVARTVAAWSQYEGEQKAERQRASNRQRVETGYWQFSNRPFGYQRVKGEVQVIEDEAAVIRECYERILAGESYYAVAASLNRRGVTTLQGSEWKPWRVQRMLENHHYAGIVSHLGEVREDIEPQWEAIVSRRTFADFTELKTNRKVKRSWAVSTKYLLSGLLRCGRTGCGEPMFSHAQLAKRPDADGKRKKYMQYICHRCHGCSLRSVHADELVEAVVLERLSDTRIVDALRVSPNTAPVMDEISKLRSARENVTALLVDGTLSRREAREQLTTLGARLDVAQNRLAAMRRQSPLTDLALARSIPGRWAKLSIPDKRRIIAELGMELTVAPGRRGRRPKMPDGTTQTAAEAARSRVAIAWAEV